MVNKRIGIGAALLAGVTALLVTPAAQASPSATIRVPSGFVPSLSDTRTNGHYEVTSGGGLRLWTDGASDKGPDGRNSDKVAEYVATETPLSDVQNPTLDFTNTTGGGAPGYQLVVDVDNDGTPDGILVGEPAYDGRWWLASASSSVDWSGAPGAADGYAHSADLTAWRAAYRNAEVTAFGFSLGSGVRGDGILNAIGFAGTRYRFTADVILHSKDECKDGGWSKSTLPTYRNQGECVSHFASSVRGRAFAE